MPDSRMIKRIMKNADTWDSRMAIAGDKLYFTVKLGTEIRLIEYDLEERRYMQYGGFKALDIVNLFGELMLVTSSRYVEKWGDGSDFDGEPINAYWYTPLTDLGDKSVIKSLDGLSLRGEGSVRVETTVGRVTDEAVLTLPGDPVSVAELPLKNEGRVLRVCIKNVAGSAFRLVGGLELSMNIRRRTE